MLFKINLESLLVYGHMLKEQTLSHKELNTNVTFEMYILYSFNYH